MLVTIIDYGSGNLRSAAKSFERAARESGTGATIAVTSDPDEVARADRIVLPGVGAFADCAAGLKNVDGMWQALEETVRGKGRPFLGICVGMQLMAERGLEHGETAGFGWIPGQVELIRPASSSLKVPHMGWNTLMSLHDHELFHSIELGSQGLHAYFVHSYHLIPERDTDLLAVCEYGGLITAAVAHDNMAGTQFHPEKSQALGLKLITNFLNWSP
jgi:glutamine amidotransferase